MKTSKNTLKNWFKTGDYPTQQQFWNWMDSYWHKDEPISIEAVADLLNILNSKATTQQTDSLQQQINNINLSDLEIGAEVINSTPKSILFVDEDGKLGEITNFQYDENDESLSFLNDDGKGLLVNYDTEVDDGVFESLNGIAKFEDGEPEIFVGIADLSVFNPEWSDGALITSDDQVLIMADEQVFIMADEQVAVQTESFVAKSDEFRFQPIDSPTLIDIQRDINAGVDMLLMKLNGAESDSVLAIKDKGVNRIFTIENESGDVVLSWVKNSSMPVVGMSGDAFIMPDAYEPNGNLAGGYAAFGTNDIGDVFAPAFMTFNRNDYSRDVITLFKQDTDLSEASYVANNGIEDATWGGYTIGQLFQAMINMNFLN